MAGSGGAHTLEKTVKPEKAYLCSGIYVRVAFGEFTFISKLKLLWFILAGRTGTISGTSILAVKLDSDEPTVLIQRFY